MADKIVRKYNMSASGILSIDEDGRLYVSCEDGAQDVSVAKLLEDFDGRKVKISCNYDEDAANCPSLSSHTTMCLWFFRSSSTP